jgi:hypothetical protein
VGLPASVAQSGAGSSLGTKILITKLHAGEIAISPEAGGNADNTATVAMPDDFVLQRITPLPLVFANCQGAENRVAQLDFYLAKPQDS